jgi:hypothetical protein
MAGPSQSRDTGDGQSRGPASVAAFGVPFPFPSAREMANRDWEQLSGIPHDIPRNFRGNSGHPPWRFRGGFSAFLKLLVKGPPMLTFVDAIRD